MLQHRSMQLESQNAMARVRAALKANDPSAALVLLRSLGLPSPYRPHHAYLSALALFQTREVALAGRLLRICLVGLPAQGEAWVLLAAVHRKLGNSTREQAVVRRAFVLAPDDLSVLRRVLSAALEAGSVQPLFDSVTWTAQRIRHGDLAREEVPLRALTESAFWLDETVLRDELVPRAGPRLLQRLAVIWAREHRFDLARLAVDHALVVEGGGPQAARLHFQRATIETHVNDLESASTHFQVSLILDPALSLSWRDLAGVLWRIGPIRDLDPMFVRADQSADPKRNDMLFSIRRMRARYLGDNGRTETAAACFASAARIAELGHDDLIAWAHARLCLNDADGAFLILRDLHERLPKGGGGVDRRLIQGNTVSYCRRAAKTFEVLGKPILVSLKTGSKIFPEINYQIEAPFLTCLENASVFPGQFHVVTADGVLLADRLIHSASKDRLVQADLTYVAGNGVVAALMREPVVDPEEAILIGGGPNFYHTLIDWFSRVGLLEGRSELSELPLVLSDLVPETTLELLGLMGIDRDRIRLLAGGPRTYSSLWVPSLMQDRFGYVAPAHLDYLERAVYERFRDPGGRGRRRLFVTRRGTTHRRLSNEAEIEALLTKIGFELFEPQRATIVEQIECFADAEVVVGSFGAGLVGMLAAPHTTAIVELTHSRAIHPMFAILAAHRGQYYRQIVGRPAISGETLAIHADFFVDPQDLIATLMEIGLGWTGNSSNFGGPS